MSYYLNTYELDEVFPMTETVSLRYTLDEECPIDEYVEEGIMDGYLRLEDGTYQVVFRKVDETLIESMNPDDLAEFFGIESEFVIAVEVIQ
jgi:predicted P-loop ATPase/GTPase